MSPPEGIESLSREELLALVLQLQRKLTELETSVQELRAEVDRRTRENKPRQHPFPKAPGYASPSVLVASLVRGPSPSGKHPALKRSLSLP
jgi:hypothetical protein